MNEAGNMLYRNRIATVAVEIVLCGSILLAFSLLLSHDDVELLVISIARSSVVDSLDQAHDSNVLSVIVEESA